MRLLFATLPHIQRLIPNAETLYTVGFALIVIGLECSRHLATNDLYDLVAALALALAVAVLLDRHRRQPLAWISWLTRRSYQLTRQFSQLSLQIGIDLRGSPAVPHRLPPIFWRLMLLLSAVITASALVWNLYPGGWREVGIRTSYTLYLVGILGLWAATLFLCCVGLYVYILLVESLLPSSWSSADRRKLQFAILLSSGMTLGTLAMWVPLILVLVPSALLAAMGLALVIRYGRSEPGLLWRRQTDHTIYSLPMWQATLALCLVLAATLVAILMAGTGGRLLTFPQLEDAMIVTQTLAFFAAWLSPLLAGGMLLAVWSLWQYDPARPIPLSLTVTSHPESSYIENLNQAVAVLRGWGWEVSLSNHPQPKGFGLHLVPEALSQAKEFDPDWPLKVSLEDLHDGEVKDRFVRKEELHIRRQVMRGVSTLFKKAISERRTKGGGYWFAPQWWFYPGLFRDPPQSAQRTEAGNVGLAYNSVFPPRVRHYLYQLMRALQVDNIYVEDGVSPRTVVRVLRKMCELYDRHNGQRRAEESHFQGQPKIRVIFHDYEPCQPLSLPSGYREPKFQEMDRARVMHIFRDQGDQQAELDIPFDFFWEPSPTLSV